MNKSLMNFVDILDRNSIGLQILDFNGKKKVFFRTSAILELIKCPYKMNYMMEENNTNNNFEETKYAVIGALIHELTEFLLIQSRFKLLANGMQHIYMVYDNLVQDLIMKYKINLMHILDKEKIVNTAVTAAITLLENFKITDTEKVFIFEGNNFIVKITPDIIAEEGIIDLKTKFKGLPNNVSYEHAFQMNLYSYYLDLEAKLFYIDIETQQYKIMKPGVFKDIPDRLEKLANSILEAKLNNKIVFEQDKLNINNCKYCKYKNKCGLYRDFQMEQLKVI